MADRLPSRSALAARIRELESRLREAEDGAEAIRHGTVDAVVVNDRIGAPHVYTLDGADRPYRVLIEQMQEGAVTVNEDGTILYCNMRLSDMLDTPQERLIGRKLQSFLLGDDAAMLCSILHEATGSGTRRELTTISAKGRQLPVYLSLAFLRRDGDLPLLCGVVTDLTEQKHHMREVAAANKRLLTEMAERAKIEEALRHAQKMEAIGTLAAGVAHDFNNILQSIVGGLELVMDETADGSRGRQFAGIALNAAMRGSSLTHHLLSYARKQLLVPQLVELSPFLADLRTLLGRTLGPNIGVVVRMDGTPTVLVDPGQLQTALLNLAINAAHAMAQGGTLTIDVRAASASQKLVVITVIDTGRGMDASTLAQSVEPFFTTKGVEGTGLGLSMVQGFIEQSGGKFGISSVLGQGTRVELGLPSGAPAPAQRPIDPAAPRQPGRILLVDDAADVLVTTAAFLEGAGFMVVRAGSGERAMALLAAGGPFDALVSDYAMPGLNGSELILKSRMVQSGLAAVIITGFAATSFARELPERTLVLQKPFHRATLMDALGRVMACSEAGG